jgi:hypothetical protein
MRMGYGMVLFSDMIMWNMTLTTKGGISAIEAVEASAAKLDAMALYRVLQRISSALAAGRSLMLSHSLSSSNDAPATAAGASMAMTGNYNIINGSIDDMNKSSEMESSSLSCQLAVEWLLHICHISTASLSSSISSISSSLMSPSNMLLMNGNGISLSLTAVWRWMDSTLCGGVYLRDCLRALNHLISNSSLSSPTSQYGRMKATSSSISNSAPSFLSVVDTLFDVISYWPHPLPSSSPSSTSSLWSTSFDRKSSATGSGSGSGSGNGNSGSSIIVNVSGGVGMVSLSMLPKLPDCCQRWLIGRRHSSLPFATASSSSVHRHHGHAGGHDNLLTMSAFYHHINAILSQRSHST